jgi:long-chain acyl-CoA synthetase
MASAPRLWELLYEKIVAAVNRQSLLKRSLFHRVMKYRWLAALFRRWNLPPLPQLQGVVGGALRTTISGGGALPAYVDQFFNSIGIAVLEGYGLTESGPVIAVRTPEQLVIGTVGPPLPETDIKIIDLENGKVLYPDPCASDLGRGRRGEICARGPQMMKGYYRDEEGTARALREGWLHTGDIGLMTPEGCLKIVGRCKETIVLLNGENVEPLPIESRLLQSPLIAQCMVVGQDQKQLGVLIVPDPSVVTERPAIQEQLLSSEIRRLISSEHGFKSFEKIGPWRLLSKPFEVGDELTGTYKLKRHLITERYHKLIHEMFAR